MTHHAPGRIRTLLAALLPLLVGSSALPVRAQGPGAVAFQTYGTDQGLGSLLVESIEEDDAGFLWVGGTGGLYRLEDQRFRRIGTFFGLGTDAVRCLARDSGGLWVGTELGLFRFDGQGFEHMGRGLPEGSVEAMARDVSGRLWVVVDRRLWVGGAKGFEAAALGPVLQIWADSGKPRVLALAADGHLYQIEGGATEWTRLGRGPELGNEHPGALLQDHAGQIWVRSRTHLFRGEPGHGFQSLSSQLPGPASGEGHLHLDRLGRVWVPTAQGLMVFERGGFSAPRFDFPRSSGLARTVMMDREGTLWVAGEEVHRLLGQGAWSLHRTAEGLPANAVRGLQRDAQGNLWAATSLGLARGGSAGWDRVPGTEGTSFSALALAPDGQIWAAGPRGLLVRSRGAGAEPLRLRGLQDAGGAITAMQFDAEGRLWAATQGSGLFRIRLEGGQPVAEAVQLPNPDSRERFSALALDKQGVLWAGGQRGLAIFEGNRWRRQGNLEGIPGSCLALAPNPGGGVWASFGPEGSLLRLRWDGERAHIDERIEDFKGLPQNPLLALAVDHEGVVWAGSAQGLLRFGGGGIDLFGKGEGLPGSGCNPGALWVDATGDVWAGTSGGIGRFRAALYRGRPQPPRTELVEARFGRNSVWAPGFHIYRVPVQEASAEFTVATQTHLDPAKIIRQFRLVNFDDVWHDLDGVIARYPRLPHGLYQFEVRSRMLTTGWGPPAILRFEVLTPWYRSWWLLSLGVFAVGGLLVLGYRRLVGALRSRNVALEGMVEQRTQDLKTALGAAEEANRAKDDFLATMSHEIRTPMHAVLGMTNLLLDSKLSRDQKESAQTIKHAATALMSIINDILDFSQIEASRIALRSVPFNLRDLAEELVDLMAVTAHQKGLELVLRFPDPGPGMLIGDPDRLRQILVNLLGNAIKFTAQGFVMLDVESLEQTPDRERFRVSVSDSGVGIAPDKQKILFQKFSQADTSIGRRFGGTGLGLAIMRHLVERMGGKIGLRSAEGKGSTFWFEVDLPRVEGSMEPGPAEAWGGLRIMVVDDLEPARRALADRLAGWGIAVGAAGSLEEAKTQLLRAAEFKDPFNLVLLDDSLAGDASAAAALLRETAGDRPFVIVALCPMHQPVDAAGLQDAGLQGLLRKPFHDWELRDTLNGAANQLAGRRLGEWMGDEEAVLDFEATKVESVKPAWEGGPPRVLLVEDNPLNQQVALRLLGGLGITAAVAGSGLEAVEKGGTGNFDVILMDVHMPGMDGVQATQAIRASEGPRRTPIVAMTAHALERDRERFIGAGMDAFLTKPFGREDLRRTLERVFRGQSSLDRTPSGSSALLVVDRRALLNSMSGEGPMDREGLKELLDLFERHAPKHLQTLAEAVGKGDAAAAREAAHSLCGSSAYVYARGLVASCKEAEEEAYRGDLDALRARMPLLEAELTAAWSLLEGIRAEFA